MPVDGRGDERMIRLGALITEALRRDGLRLRAIISHALRRDRAPGPSILFGPDFQGQPRAPASGAHGAGRTLFQTFFRQFFASESVTSDMQLRQTIVWILAFLIAPLLILTIQIFPHFASVAIRAVRFHDTELLDDTLEWIELLFVSYSMVTIGLITVFVWDALSFDRRDAMVLGPLPVRQATVAGAKLAALGAFLLLAAGLVTLPSGFLFAMETSDQLGALTFVTHLVAHLAATVGAAAFTFAAIVAFRGVVVIVAGARAASAIGPLMQFLFVVLILSFVILTPAVWKIPHATLVNPTVTGWLPSSWFLGLFERVRGSSRAYFVPLATRALIALSIAVAAAIAVSVATFRQQMRLALTPPAKPGSIGVGTLIRHLARALAGRDPAARATAVFVVVTLGRNRRQQGPVAMTAAIGAAIVLASLTQKVRDLESLMQPRTIVLWIPLVLTYWSVLGLRTAFLVPSELPAAVTFASHGPTDTHAYWSGVRGATIAVLAVPVTLVALVVTGLLVGWPIAAWHTAFVAGMVVTLVELAVLSVDRVPFTRPYAAGDGLLRTRWPLYLFGMFAFAYWPVRIELQLLGGGEPWLVAGAAGAASVCHLVGRARARRWSVTLDEPASDGAMISVLDIGAVVRPVAPVASTPSAS
jgi:hypothetical protein